MLSYVGDEKEKQEEKRRKARMAHNVRCERRGSGAYAHTYTHKYTCAHSQDALLAFRFPAKQYPSFFSFQM
jgi:hypothetical protein